MTVHRAILSAAFLSLLLIACTSKESASEEDAVATIDPRAEEWQLLQKALDSLTPQLRPFLHNKRMNEEVAVIAHLGIHSGLARMVVLSLPQRKIIDSGCVSHGSGHKAFTSRAVFSNTVNSYCSSLGKYRIGGRYIGNYGLAYKLHGLDSTNSNAFERNIVLHSYQCVPEHPVFPDVICNSQGCPMVSPGFLQRLSTIIDSSARPVMLVVVN